MPRIHEAIIGMLADVEHIKKDQKNTQQGYKFRGIDDVYNAIHPLLAKHGVFLTCEVLSQRTTERETKSGGVLFFVRNRYRYTLHAADGSSIATEAVGEAMDSGDKASNKSMSVAFKYSLFQLLCIPTEAVDSDKETFTDVKPSPKPAWGEGAPSKAAEKSAKPWGNKPWSKMTEPERVASTMDRIEVIGAMEDKRFAQGELKKLSLNPAMSQFSEENQVKMSDAIIAMEEYLLAAVS